jgi:hypothetical protein
MKSQSWSPTIPTKPEEVNSKSNPHEEHWLTHTGFNPRTSATLFMGEGEDALVPKTTGFIFKMILFIIHELSPG